MLLCGLVLEVYSVRTMIIGKSAVENEVKEVTDESSLNELVISAPRSLWMEFILHFSTLSIYTCFWFVARTREFNALSKKKFTPWLWFFVPFIVIAQLIALPKFNNALSELAEEHNVSIWNAWYGGWTLGVVLITLAMNISDKIEFPGWTYLVGVILWSILFTVIQAQINKVKENLRDVTFKGSRHNYTKLEWFFVVPLFPLSLIFMFYIAIDPLFNKQLSTLSENTLYTDPQNIYSLPIIGKGWSIVENGTHSNGEAELELQGPLSDMFFIIFSHGVDESIESISHWRTEQLYDELSGVKCEENRSFAKLTLSIVSHVQCSGRNIGDSVLATVSLIETDKGIYELYGMLSSVKYSFKNNESMMKKMSKGFEPL